MIKVEEIKELLAENPEVSAYEIKQTVNEGKQLYFVGKKLETSRAVNTEEIGVTVYHDFEQFRGNSGFSVTANDTRESVASKIADCVVKAKQGRNPYFPLAEKGENICERKQLAEPVIESLKKVADEVFAADHFENSSLNATELFGDVNHVRFLNSNGVDHSFDKTSLFIETIPSYKSDDEYELYYSQNDGTLEPEGLTAAIETELKNVKYRSEARRISDVELPEGIDVHIKDDMLGRLMMNFASELSYQSNFFHSNHYSIGDEISPRPFTITMKGVEEGALSSSPVDANGVALGQTAIIKDGKAAALWGDLRFGTYLKQENITGSYPVMVLDGYQPISEEDFNKPHITVMSMSSPQLDSASGHFGGEVRLALYVNGDQIIPLTGFSISGNFYEQVKTAEFSEEQGFINTRFLSFKGPKYMILKGMSIH